MNLADYFNNKRGTGVLATSDKNGVVNTALYARPHITDSTTVAFIMRERLTHQNLQENNHAGYLFIEDGEGYNGIRMSLSKLDESSDAKEIEALTRRHASREGSDKKGKKYLVRFKVNRVFHLVGGNELPIE